MPLQTTQICFYESDYVTLHTDMSIMTENGAKITRELPKYQFYAIIIWHPLEKYYFKHTMRDERCCRLVKWLCLYSCYLNLLNHG